MVAVHPENSDVVYCSGFEIHRSTNGGSTFQEISPFFVHVDHHAIAFNPSNPQTMYFGTDGGIFKTMDGGGSFIDVNDGYMTTQFYPGFANSPMESNLAIGGLQDNGTLKYSGTNFWSPIYFNDGGWCAIDPGDTNMVYAETQYAGLVRSNDGGGSFFAMGGGLPPTGDPSGPE